MMVKEMVVMVAVEAVVVIVKRFGLGIVFVLGGGSDGGIRLVDSEHLVVVVALAASTVLQRSCLF